VRCVKRGSLCGEELGAKCKREEEQWDEYYGVARSGMRGGRTYLDELGRGVAVGHGLSLGLRHCECGVESGASKMVVVVQQV